MKKFAILFILIAVAALPVQGQKRQSEPSTHVIKPSAKRPAVSPYQSCRNYGKTIAVFGGSLSVNKESDVAKQLWADLLNARVTSYGVPGAGFASSRGYSIQKQVDTAGVFDVYVLWASTNDFAGNEECGSWVDYSGQDGYDESRLDTQCGGINYCIRKLREKNPEAEIYFFTSLRFFRRDSGYNPYSADVNETGETFYDYVQSQIDCCRYHGVPVLDQFSLQNVDIHNCARFYKEDKLHMNEAGYRRIAPMQAAFLANGY
jgi:lysophospholipase L1-like esterase